MMKTIAHLRLPAKTENLSRFLNIVDKSAQALGFHREKLTDLKVAVDEALVNIMSYAYDPSEEGDASLTIKSDRNRTITIEIADFGAPFNVLTLDTPDVQANLSERKIGGLGVYFIRQLMDQVSYRYEGGQNILCLTMTETTD